MNNNSETLVELLRWRADNQPDKAAFIFLEDGERTGGSFTYKELDIRAKSIAAKLQMSNLKNERALLIYESGLEYLDSFFGCLYAGVISVPLHLPGKNKSLSRISAIAKDSDAKVILSTREISGELKNEFSKDDILKKLDWIKTETISDDLAVNWKDDNVKPDTLAYLQYTSGSTGIPKGVMVNHENLLTNLNIIDKSHPHDDNSVMVTWLPIHHDMGLIYGILLPFYCGYPCYFMTPQAFVQKPYRWLNAISKYKGTHNAAPNFAFELCVNKITEEQKKTLDLSSWTAAMNAAEPVRSETIKKFTDYFESCGFRLNHFCPGYGLAEGTLILTSTFTKDEPVMRRFDDNKLEKNNLAVFAEPEDNISKIHVGHSNSIEDTRIAIVNPVTLIECKDGEVGEVWASGKSIAQGYWLREDATKETFKACIADTNEGPFLRTGDLGFMTENELYITGRHKDLIIIRGQNHYPQDIEYTVEASHPALRLGCVAAFSIEEDDEEHLGIVQEIQKNFAEKFNADEVVKAIRKAVSEEHDLQVSSITLIEPGTVPKTSSGKIQRRACSIGITDGSLEVIAEWKKGVLTDNRKPVKTESPVTVESEEKSTGKNKFVLTKGNLKDWLVANLSDMMQIKKESIDVTESFAVYGMDSLKAVQLSGDLETLLEKELPSTLVYDYPNINSLTNYLCKDLADQPGRDTESVKTFSTEIKNEPVAIIGIGLKFPEANNVNEFWKNLITGRNSISRVPENRWNKNLLNPSTVTFGGFVDDADKFDPVFFGISPREAVQIDPQQRFTLEVAWQAFEDAGINPDKLAGQNVGVFIGNCSYDYARYSAGRKDLFDVYTGTGTSLSIAANRLSYFFDFRGPSIVVDTACSSSLVALHLACQSLQSSQSELAIAGGVNLLLSPDWNIVFTEADMLAPDGRCKTFDANADGYVRSEGCGIIVLKKLFEAERDGDRIYAVIKGSAINQDGKSNGLTAPNGPSQVAVIKNAIDNAGVSAKDVSYVETHGTGTPLGDPIEVNSLKEALKTNRSENDLLYIGSVKTNIGHIEAAAGIAGVIKTSLALFNNEIPRHLNYKKLNPEILIEGSFVKIADKNIPWKGNNRFAGISSFGFGGTNAHVILQNAPELKHETAKSKPFNILTLSAKNEDSLKKIVTGLEQYISENDGLKLEDICFSANSRASHNHRLAFVSSDIDDLKKEFKKFKNNTESFDIISGTAKINHSSKIAFLFPGQGAQYIGMGKELYDTNPLFRKTINRCDEILRNYLDKSLLEVLFYEKDENLNPINETMYTQPALFAIEYALAQVWMSWGIKPAVMMGHSAGEYIAACLAGVFSLEDGLKLVTERGRLMETLTSNGEMYTIFANETAVKVGITGFEGTVSVASINSPFKTVISGNKESLAKILSEFDKQNIEYKKINVSIASHSPLMNSMIEEFRKVCNTVKYSLPLIPVVSNITGEVVNDDKISNADYWCNHILSGVRFSDSIKACVNYGCDTFIDLGPKPTSIGMAQETVIDANLNWLPSFKKNFTIWETMLQGLGRMFIKGVNPDWIGFEKDFSHKLISLPNYPFQKQRYWIDEVKGNKPKSFSAGYSNSEHAINDLTGSKLNSASKNEFIFNSVISASSPPYLNDHRVFGNAVLPGASYIEIALSAGSAVLKNDSLKISGLIFHKPLIFENGDPKNIQTILSKKDKHEYKFEIFSLGEEENSDWKLHASGSIQSEVTDQNENSNLSKLKKHFTKNLSVDNFYNDAKSIGIEYGKYFRGIKELYVKENETLGLISLDEKLNSGNYKIHPSLLDAAFQTALGLLMKLKSDKAFIPAGIEKFELIGHCSNEIWSHVKVNENRNGSSVHKVDLNLFSKDGNKIAVISGLQLKEVSKDEFSVSKDEQISDWFYEINWTEQKIADKILISDFIPSDKNIKKIIENSFDKLASELKLKHYRKGILELEELGILYIIKSFSDQGLSLDRGSIFSEKDFNISGQHLKLFRRLIEILKDRKIIKQVDGGYELNEIIKIESINEKTDSIKKSFPEIAAELNLLTVCGKNLSEVLSGKTDPLALLFPDGDLSLTTNLYQNSPAFAAMNISIEKLIKNIADKLPEDRALRILEIGSGTGSTSSYILKILPESRTKYLFTDLSPAFFAKAKVKFQEYEFIDYRVLDVEKEVTAHGFEKNSFDIVIASNVIHAAKDLKTAFDNIKDLLAPKGIFILNEVTEPKIWIDLTFGLTGGWWRFEDSVLRPSYPLLTNKKWKEFLVNYGFRNVNVLPFLNGKEDSLTSQTIISAEATEIFHEQISQKYLVFFGDDKSASNISKYLKHTGQNYTIVKNSAKEKFERNSANEFEINFSDKDKIKKVLKEINAEDKTEISIIFINSHSGSLKTEDVEKLSDVCCLNAVNIIQSVPASGFKSTPSFYIVTHDSQKVSGDDNLKGLLYSALWGLGKVINMEHPEFRCRLIDIDSKHEIESVINEINSDSSEEQVAFRNGKRFVSRLERIKSRDGDFNIKEDATYLITGGLGGLGILTAKFLADKGAKHLILTGRNTDVQSSNEILNGIISGGTEVIIKKADVTVKEDLEKIFKEISKSGYPLKGIVHSAGVLDDGVIMNQTKIKFDKVLAPKVLGAWYLHELTKTLELDFFVMYSSVASLLGSAGQSNHSSANAFMDALAHFRKSKGKPALSINWGVWSDIGSAAAKGADKGEKISGIQTIDPESGIKALEIAMRTDSAQIGIVPINWKKFTEKYKISFVKELFRSETTDEKNSSASDSENDLISQLKISDESEQFELLINYFRNLISRIMGLEPEDLEIEIPLNMIGLDSLMAIELKNKVNIELGVDLNLVRYMEETNIIQLAGELKDQLQEVLSKEKDFLTVLRTAPSDKHNELLIKYFQNLISGIMGLDADELDTEQPLNTVGLDSLMAIELKNKVNIELGADLNLVKYMEEINIVRLAEELMEQLPLILNKNSASVKVTVKEKSEEDKTRDLLGNIDNLTEEELEQLLKEMN